MKRGMLILLSVAMVFLAACSNNGSTRSALAANRAPDFTLTDINGAAATLSSLRQNGKAILFFWATWCPHCREQFKMLVAKKEEFKKEGVTVVLIDIGEEKSAVERFLAGRGGDFKILMDTKGEVANQYDVIGVPTMVFIGAEGNVRDVLNMFPDNYAEILK